MSILLLIFVFNQNQTMTINGVTIGDKFKNGKHIEAEVVDFHIVTSLKTGKVISHQCIAIGTNTMAKNEFTVPFATVLRHKI